MHQPEISSRKVHYLHGTTPLRPSDDDMMRTLLRELSDARPVDSVERTPDKVCVSQPGQNMAERAQQAHGQGNIQISSHDVIAQTVQGDNNIQISAVQLIVQLAPDQQQSAVLNRLVFRLRHVAALGLLVVAFLC